MGNEILKEPRRGETNINNNLKRRIIKNG